MSKFTPGPWIVSDTEFYAEIKQIKTGNNVAMVAGWHDARLIAAAPDIYELVRWKLIEGGCGLEWGERARAALAKADGEVAE